MDGWQIGRLLTAAEIAGHFLELRLAVLMRGDDPWLLLEVIADPDVQVEDDGYARWSPGFRAQVPSGWPRGAGNPWLACSYSGRLNTLTVPEVDRLIEDVADRDKSTGARLTALIEAHLDDAAIDPKNRKKVVRFLKKDFEAASISTLMRPAETNDDYDLTLRSADGIHQAVLAGKRLNATQRRQAAVLLKYAPLQFGYWGPFKALVKSAPAETLADAYAVAIARLSSTNGAVEVPPNIAIESVDELQGWFGIPSKRTQQYLARRVRRDLVSLANRSPEAYALVATRMLISWDQPLSNYSYAPAFVMLGARNPLDSRSRYVYRPADMVDRRDAHPEAWNSRAELTFRVFRSIRNSVEALTWAFQVLDFTGAAPELSRPSIALALESTYPPLRQLACSTLSRRPKLFDNLTEDQWALFLRHVADTDVQEFARALANRQTPPKLLEALGPLLARARPQSDRRTHLALLYLLAYKTSNGLRDDSVVDAVIAVIQSSGVKQQSLWGPVVAGMRKPAVLRVYRSLVDSGVTGTPLDIVSNTLLQAHYLDADLIVDCLASDSDKVVDLGWRLVEARGGRQFVFTELLPSAGYGIQISSHAVARVVRAAIQRIAEPQDAVALVRWALCAGIDSRALTGLLSGNLLCLNAVWDALDSEKDGRIGRWLEATPEAIPLIVGALTTEELDAATPTQLRPLLDYVGKNPGTVEQEEWVRLAAIRSAAPKLQADALQQLRRARGLQRNWLTVAESGFPAGLDAARKYLESVKSKEKVRRGIMECLDSGSPQVQNLGVQLLQSREALADDPEILAALGRCGDRLAQNLVAEAASSGIPVDRAVLADFDRRILTDRQASLRARELVKKRLEEEAVAPEPDSAECIAAVIQMARTGNKGDREWALMRLATWALHGAEIEGLEISLTTEGVIGLEDVAP